MHNSTSELFLTDKDNYSLRRDCLWRMISLSPLQKSLPVSSLVKKRGLVLVLRLVSFHPECSGPRVSRHGSLGLGRSRARSIMTLVYHLISP